MTNYDTCTLSDVSYSSLLKRVTSTMRVPRVNILLTCYLLCELTCFVESKSVAQIVSIADVGTFEGRTQDVQFKSRGIIQTRKIDTFLGIQYAKSPTGALRFAKPEIVDSYPSTVNATNFGPLCTQSGIFLLPKKFPVSEDCLYLNIYKPHNGRRLPVMVFLHGGFGEGRYQNGGANFLSGDVLAVYADIIVVTLNYRLGLLGFYATDDIEGVSRGNYGLWDQHTALLWVHRHIEGFGGDPNRVTLAGQQTGGICALYQAMYPGNKGFFQQVITQSGSPLELAKTYEGAFTKRPESYGISYSLGCLVTEFEDTISCLRNFTHDKLALLMETLRWPVSPAYDGEFIKADPKTMLDPSNNIYNDIQEFFSSLNMIIGYNSMDGLSFFTNLWIPKFMWSVVRNKNISHITVSKNVFKESVDYTVNVNMFGIPYRNKTEPSQTILSRYYNILKPDEYRNVIIQFSTDYYYLTPALLLTNVRQRLLKKYKTPQKKVEQTTTHNTYLYKFDVKPGFQFRYWETPSWIEGPALGDELPFLFGFSRSMLDSLNVTKDYIPSEEEMMVAEQVMTKWGEFVKTG